MSSSLLLLLLLLLLLFRLEVISDPLKERRMKAFGAGWTVEIEEPRSDAEIRETGDDLCGANPCFRRQQESPQLITTLEEENQSCSSCCCCCC